MPTYTDTTQTETFYLDNRGFLYLKFIRDNNDHLITVDQINSYLDTISKIRHHNISSILVDLRYVKGIVSIESLSFKLLAKDIRLKSVCNKIAFITNSHALNLKLNNYIARYRPAVSTKAYNDIEDGINFCKN